MKVISLIIICCLAVSVLIGFFIGLHKGYTRVKSWGAEYLFCSLGTVAFGSLIYNKLGVKGGVSAAVAGFITICIAVILLIIFWALCSLLRKLINGKIKAREELSYYEQYEDMEENKEQILDAVYDGDKKEYNKLTRARKKFKPEQGGWRMADKFVGAVFLMLKALVVTGLISAVVLLVLQISGVGFMKELFLTSSWRFFSKNIFDFILIALLYLCVKCGYSNGLSSSLVAFVSLILAVGAGFLSYHLVFGTSLFDGAAANLAGKLSQLTDKISSVVNLSGDKLARIIFTIGVFLVFMVEVVLFAIFFPKLLDYARQAKTFRVIDGVFGALFVTLAVFGVELLLGWILQSIHDLEFMQGMNVYFDRAVFSNYFYGENILNALGLQSPNFLYNLLAG